MRKLYFLLIITLVLSCNKNEDKYTKFTFEFSRSFEAHVILTIDLEKENLNIVKTEYYEDSSYTGVFHIQPDKITELFKNINNISYQNDTLNVSGVMGLHGQVFRLSKISELDTHYIVSRNPRRKIGSKEKFKNDYELLNLIFDFVTNNIQDNNVFSLSKELYNDYGCKLQFKKIINSPLEYSVWGVRIANSREKDNLTLENFLANLPKNEPVIIELNTLEPFEHIKFDKEKHKNIYFYGDDYLEFLEKNYLELTDQENSNVPSYIIDTLFSKYCLTPKTCDFKNGNHNNHSFYHQWKERKIELSKFWGQYYLRRKEIIGVLES
jgi:hypothetical protein